MEDETQKRPAERGRTGHDALGCVCGRLRMAARAVTQAYDAALEPSGLTITQFGLLAALYRLGPMAVGELAREMGMDRTTMTRNLRPLEARGLIEALPDAEDRRRRRLALTGAGEEAFAAALPLWRAMQARVRARLGPYHTKRLFAELDAAMEAVL